MNRTQPSLSLSRFLTLVTLAILGSPAWAHGGHGDLSHFMDAAIHPWTGADHVCAAIAAGMVGAHVGGRKGTLVILAYLAGMLAGAFAFNAAPQWLEVALALSVAGLGLVLLRPAMAGARLAIFTAALFATLHGSAHFLESGMGSGVAAAAAGFEISTAALLVLGFGLQTLLHKFGATGRVAAWPLVAIGAGLAMSTL